MRAHIWTANVILLLASIASCIAGEDALDEHSGDETALVTGEVVSAGEVLRVTATALNLRSAGNTSAPILATLRNGDRLTVATTSGATGWVNVRTADNVTGWVHGAYVVRDQGPTGETCAPARGQGVVGQYQKALHDAIAYAEGTRNYSRDGYNVMFSFRLFDSCATHPNQCIPFGNTCSTAAGRYQFLNRTWNSVRAARGLTSFEPENQERGAAYLISVTRRVSVPQDRPMTAAEFENAMSRLSYEWASLPPGRYGQPNRSMAQMRSMYCSLAGC